jgi:hypothetical protein
MWNETTENLYKFFELSIYVDFFDELTFGIIPSYEQIVQEFNTIFDYN